MTRPLPLAILLAALASQAPAQEVDCANAEAQQDLNLCAEMDWQTADEALNAAYQDAMTMMQEMDASLPPELQGAAEALLAAQRAWIDYRDAHCTTAGFPMRGGSAEALLVFGCLRQTTENRTAELLELAAY